MAGTRLLIESVTLLELLALALWSFYYGLCRNEDVLCRTSTRTLTGEMQQSYSLPDLHVPHSLPSVQVERQLHPDTNIEWKKNPNTVIVCSQPESPVVQGQHFWWCYEPQQAEPRVVVRKSSMLIYSKETHLPVIAKPDISDPFLLTVHLVFETTDSLAVKAQELSTSLEESIAQLQDWPCVERLQVKMNVVPSRTAAWIDSEALSNTADNNLSVPVPMQLPKITLTQAQSLLDGLDLVPLQSNKNGENVIIYFPALETHEVQTFQVDDSQQLFMVGGLDSTRLHQWLSTKVGIPHVDGDGSFPTWYEDWYWYSAAQKLSPKIVRTFSRVQHLVDAPLALEPSHSIKEHYSALVQLHQQLETLLTQTHLQANFPIEHYAAIFAPLLFPLLLPLLVGTIKELQRYKEKKKANKEASDMKEKLD